MQDILVLQIAPYALLHSCVFLSDLAVHCTDNGQTLSSYFLSTEKIKKEKKQKVKQSNDEMTNRKKDKKKQSKSP